MTEPPGPTPDAPAEVTAPTAYRKLVIRRAAAPPDAFPPGLKVGDRLAVTLFGSPADGPGTVTAVDDTTVTIQWGTDPGGAIPQPRR